MEQFPHYAFGYPIKARISHSESENVLTTVTDRGAPVNELLSIDNIASFQLLFRMSEAQYTVLNNWIKTKLNNGQAWFLMELPYDITSSGSNSELEVNFMGDRPKMAGYTGKFLNVVFSVVVRKLPEQSEQWVDDMLGLIGGIEGDPEEFLDRLAIYANEDQQLLNKVN